tara:strand:+ start:214 stop:453 length:240 start_codon:yes stop_codon:yes gene_type:complete
MKTVRFSNDCNKALRKLRGEASRIVAKIERYAETGAGDVTAQVGTDYMRIRIGDYRAILSESDTEILVVRIGHRREIYE